MQDHVVVEAGRLVEDFSAAQQGFDVGEFRDLFRDEVEPSGVEREFGFVGHPAGDAFAELPGGGAVRSPFEKRFRMVGREQGIALEVAEEDPAAGFQDPCRSCEHAGEVGGVREILRHGVDDDRVEVRVRDPAEIIGRAVEKFHLRRADGFSPAPRWRPWKYPPPSSIRSPWRGGRGSGRCRSRFRKCGGRRIRGCGRWWCRSIRRPVPRCFPRPPIRR